MDYSEISIGMKVTYQGQCHVVRKINAEDSGIMVRPLRAAYGGNFAKIVPADSLSPWTPVLKISAHAKTCQICGRHIYASKGIIAHHGYTRPGDGWQTASCYGARHEPFETSRDTLGLYIEMCNVQLAKAQARRDELYGGKVDVIRLENKLDENGRAMYTRDQYGKRDPIKHLITYTPTTPGYGKALEKAINETLMDITNLSIEIGHQMDRFENWKPAKVAN